MTRISRIILSILLPAILSGACRKIVPEIPDPAPTPISFYTPVVGTATKAAIKDHVMESPYNTDESFRVYAAFSSENFVATDQSSYEEYFTASGAVCSYDGSVWKTSPVYYWPRFGKLTFQACSPSDAASDMTTLDHSWSNGFTFHSFKVHDSGEMYDLLYTERVENRQRADYTTGFPYEENSGGDQGVDYNGIDLAFKHALCQIEFRFGHPMSEESNLKFWLTKLRILNAFEQGDFVSPTATWSSQSSQTDYVVYEHWNDDYQRPDGVLLNGSGSPVTLDGVEGAHTMILLPQNLDHGSGNHIKIEVTYCYGSAIKSATFVTATIDLVTDGAGNSYFKDGDNHDIEAWEVSKKYIYTLNIQPSNLFQIFLDPTVSSAWTSKSTEVNVSN